MIKITAETSACQFSYALHPALTRDDGAPVSLNIHVVINHLEPDLGSAPMLLMVEYDYLRISGGGDPCPIHIELDRLHSGIDLDRIEFRFVGQWGDHSFKIDAVEEEETCLSGRIMDFRRAA